ncbi:MAG: ASCH domain-containing protein [Pseudomonadota bacterium]
MREVPDWQTLQTVAFGDTPDAATRLAALTVGGVKTATCSAASHGPVSAVGEFQVCLNGDGKPVAIIETLSIERLPFSAVTADMAVKEGEGDLSLDSWRSAYEAYFRREGSWAPDMNVIFETFTLVDILDLHFAAEAKLHVDAERRGA